MAPKVFGWQHLTFLAVFLCIAVAAVLIVQYGMTTDKRKTVFLKCTALSLLILVVLNRISLAVWHRDAVQLLPNSYCGVTSLLLALTVLLGRPHAKLLHLLVYVALVAALLRLYIPTFWDKRPPFSSCLRSPACCTTQLRYCFRYCSCNASIFRRRSAAGNTILSESAFIPCTVFFCSTFVNRARPCTSTRRAYPAHR